MHEEAACPLLNFPKFLNFFIIFSNYFLIFLEKCASQSLTLTLTLTLLLLT
jgi:hypothetical protein